VTDEKTKREQLVEHLLELIEYIEKDGVDIVDFSGEQRAGHQGGWAPGDSFVSYRYTGRRVHTLSITTYEAATDAIAGVEQPTDAPPWAPHYPEEI